MNDSVRWTPAVRNAACCTLETEQDCYGLVSGLYVLISNVLTHLSHQYKVKNPNW